MTLMGDEYRFEMTSVDFDGDGSAETVEYTWAEESNLKEVDAPQERDASVLEANRPENNAVMTSSGQRRKHTLTWRFYDNGRYTDKSNGTVASALIGDARIAPGPIQDVDAAADEFTFDGDFRDRIDPGDDLGVGGSDDTTGDGTDGEIDGVYTVDSVSYDAGTDQTTIAVTQDITNDTLDLNGNANHSIVTVEEQIVFWAYYVDPPEITVKGRLYGGRFSDPDGDGVKEGTPVVVKKFTPRQTSDEPLRGFGIARLEVGESI